MANQFLALSLFLMLLSFFIVMNALSEYEETKTYPVLNSLSLAFSQTPFKQEQGITQEPTPRMSIGKGDTFEQLNGIFDAHISNFKMTKNRLGTQMYMHLPVDEFEKSIDIPYLKSGSPSAQGAFMPTLITLLRSEENELPYRMDMILNIPSDGASYSIDNPEGFKQSMLLVSTLAKKMEQNGLPRYLMSAGLHKGEPGYIDLIFMRYEPYSPLDSEAPEDKRP